MIKRKLSIFIGLGLLILGAYLYPASILDANAQGRRAPQQRQQQEEKIFNPYDGSFLPSEDPEYRSYGLMPQKRLMEFVRVPEMPADAAVLRITTSVGVSGCLVTRPSQVQKGYKEDLDGRTMVLLVSPPFMGLDTSKKNPSVDCPENNSFLSTLIVLVKQELLALNVKRIEFAEASAKDIYDVELTDTHITLTPQTTRVFEPTQNTEKIDPMTFWFYPKNTVALELPTVENKGTFYEAVAREALLKGLVPIENTVPDFSYPLKKGSIAYFTDRSGKVMEQLENRDSILLAKVSEDLEYMRGGKKLVKAVEHDIYARLLGPME